MKNIIFICTIFSLIFISCSPEDDICIDRQTGQQIDCDTYNNNGNNGGTQGSGYAESTYLRQTGDISINGTVLNIPIQSIDIPTSYYRVDVVIHQNSTQLSGGPFILEKNSQYFYGGSYDTVGGNPINGINDIKIEVYVVETSDSTRDLWDTLYPN